MNGNPVWLAELHDLLDRLQDGGFSESDRLRLNELLRAGAEQRECFITYMDVHSRLAWEGGHGLADEGHGMAGLTPNEAKRGMAGLSAIEAPEVRGRGPEFRVQVSGPVESEINTRNSAFAEAVELPCQSGAEIPEPLAPPIILDLSPSSRYPLTTSHSFVGGPVFSYAVALVILCMMLLGAWAYKISHYQQFTRTMPSASSPTASHEKPELVFVGQITGMVDCRWSNPQTEALPDSLVSLGRKYSLASGLMEITYDTGARVILQGPCTYEVELENGGYLSLGKLTARVEKEGETRRGGDKERTSDIASFRSATSSLPLSLSPPLPLFTVRTPTAVITDLGTEFGVEVDRNGNTTSHVYRGSVKVRVIGDGKQREVVLRRDESARVEHGANGIAAVVHQESSASGAFVRRMPRWTPIEAFNTGVGVKEGEADPHWQLVARDDDPAFKPRPAVVTAIPPDFSDKFRQNDAARSQWISSAGDMPNLTEHVTYTFRTTFELAGISDASRRSVVLQGRFMADNHVTAIRLNGKEVSVPEHGYQAPFNHFFIFSVDSGFVEGTNVLEIDVLNEAPGRRSSPVSPMALRGQLEGYMLRGGQAAAADLPKIQNSNSGKEGAN